jgi:DNA-binding IscR family transcriptional regulator
VPPDQLEDALEHLIDAGLVNKTGRAEYQLARPPEGITLGDLYRAVVAPGARIELGEWTGYSNG